MKAVKRFLGLLKENLKKQAVDDCGSLVRVFNVLSFIFHKNDDSNR